MALTYSTGQGFKYIYPKYILGDWGKKPKGGTHFETDLGQDSIHLVSKSRHLHKGP